MMDWTSGARAVGPVVAGSWYPDDPSLLAREVDAYLHAPEEEGQQARGRVVALIEPHAGYMYSGAVAGQGFRMVKGKDYPRVILLGPSHYVRFQGAALPDADAYRTPLGEVALDREAVKILERHPRFMRSNTPFAREHSLEAEIPFLQCALAKGWRLVPALMGPESSGTIAQEVADGLRPLLGEDTLVVVSSDFTHFGSRFDYVPFTEDLPHRIRELDMGAVKLIESGNVEGFEEYVETTGATICGRDAIGVLLRLLPGGSRATLIAYDTSGRITGDWGHSVSYAALAFCER